MRGIRQYNWPAFDAAAKLLVGRDAVPISPADMDRLHGIDPDEPVDDQTLIDCLKRDATALLDCDAMLLLPGWKESKGATAEKALAEAAGISAIKYDGRLSIALVVHQGRYAIKKRMGVFNG